MRSCVFLLGLVLATSAWAQQVDPSASYRTVESANFRLTYTANLDGLVKPALERAEEAYTLLQQQLVRAPRGRISIVLSDNSDVTNGFATPFPSNRIVIFVKPPVSDIDLQHFRDWLDLVITHELAHIFHLDVAGKVGRALRALFGRLQINWPFFPATESPRWLTEGLAVEFETRGTGSARLYGAFHEMVVRTAILEGRFDPIDRVNGNTPIWPDGSRAYVYGSLFMDYLARKHGSQSQSEIVKKTAGSILPPRLALNRISRRAIGETFSDEYDDWKNDLEQLYDELRDSLTATGLTRSERITALGRYAQYPRVSPDGKYLAFAEDNGRSVAHTHVMEIASGRVNWSRRRNGIGPAAWLPSGELITTQLEFDSRFTLLSDLYRFDVNGQHRLTHSARLEDADVDAAGRRIIAVENGQGSNRLVMITVDGLRATALGELEYGTNWSSPRFSPDGHTIAVSRWSEGGKQDIVLLDTLGVVKVQATDDAEAVDANPAWSPDGRYVLFWSDRTGIPNIFAYDTKTTKLLQVSNVLTGAFHPDVTPDGRTIYFSGYHADGYHIERMAFDTSTWRVSETVRAPSYLRPREPLDSAAELRVEVAAGQSRPYRAWSSLRPYYWAPSFADEGHAGTFLGISTSGTDVINRHAWAALYAHSLKRNRSLGYFSYAFNGFRNPSIGLSVSRDWDFLGNARLQRVIDADTTFSDIQVVERQDVAELATTFLLRRFRWSLALTVGGEVVNEKRMVNDSPNVTFTDASDNMIGPIARIGFANYRTPAFAISREDGILLQASGRWRVESDTVTIDRSYSEVSTLNALYRSFTAFGFAHHVIAARFSALLRSGTLPPLADVGGAPGGSFDLGVTSLGSGAGLLPVRGFESGDRFGTRAWAASLEYRLPLALVGRGAQLWPLFLDRGYVSSFVDMGNASCTAAQTLRVPACGTQGTQALLSVGVEVGWDVALLSFSNTRLRVGVGQPLAGPQRGPLAYLTFGPAF